MTQVYTLCSYFDYRKEVSFTVEGVFTNLTQAITAAIQKAQRQESEYTDVDYPKLWPYINRWL